jgi:hypothetical protein
MSKRSILLVGSIEMSVPPEASTQLLAIFRDDMTRIRQVPLREYWSHWGPAQQDDPTIPVKEYRVIGRILAERLDLMGFDGSSTLAMVSGALAAGSALVSIGLIEPWERDLIASLDVSSWTSLLASSDDDSQHATEPSLKSRSWLLKQIDGLSFLRRLRAILLVFPEAEVVLDATEPDMRQTEDRIAQNSSEAVAVLQQRAAAYAPTVVLTEGKTDAEFLKAALAILYPHLTDLIKFLDYERRPEGGVGPLVGAIRAFAAAGIVNRLVAVFDNDTAAADAIRKIDITTFAPQIKILRYPDLELARNYPTLGPPTARSPRGALLNADINGLAGSIEIYLGRDVLTQDGGSLQPIQWTSYSQGMNQYQGEIVNKAEIQEKFRRKYKKAMQDPDTVRVGDWSGLQLILDTIRNAARLTERVESEEDI